MLQNVMKIWAIVNRRFSIITWENHFCSIWGMMAMETLQSLPFTGELSAFNQPFDQLRNLTDLCFKLKTNFMKLLLTFFVCAYSLTGIYAQEKDPWTEYMTPTEIHY